MVTRNMEGVLSTETDPSSTGLVEFQDSGTLHVRGGGAAPTGQGGVSCGGHAGIVEHRSLAGTTARSPDAASAESGKDATPSPALRYASCGLCDLPVIRAGAPPLQTCHPFQQATMQQKLHHMLQLQDRLNRQINPRWLEAGYEWYRAIWLEAAELMEHYGWKWWKAQEHDLEQIRLELIDIWHFGLSAELARCGGNLEQAAQTMLAHLDSGACAEADFRTNVDALALQALTGRNLDMPAFLALLEAAGTGFDDLYRIYVGKNVLNRFRQDHGYKEGSYVKNWSGREDNEHLAELAAAMEAEGETFESELYEALEQRYPG